LRVRLAIALPYDVKRRQCRQRGTIDKWVLRKVAERYLPLSLARRKKLPFRVGAARRIQVPGAFFRDGYVAEYFDLGQQEIDYLVDRSSRTMLQKLLHLEVWMAISLNQDPLADVRARIDSHVSVTPL
jgi:asparagine synthetase B (glutamine-hydrolysing)